MYTIPHPSVSPVASSISIYRPYSGGPAMLISDGSASTHRIGWGAIVADCSGILASAYAGVQCDVGYSFAAEWAGKWEAVLLDAAF